MIFNLVGCVSSSMNDSYRRVVKISMDDLNAQIDSTEPTSVEELLNSGHKLNQYEIDVEINNKSAKVVTINEQKLLAKAFKVDPINQNEIQIKSYLVPVKNKADYLFFPVVTVYDSSKNKVSELEPEKDYAVILGVLDVKYSIPKNASYILIHTEPKYMNIGSIDGSSGGLSPSASYSSSEIITAGTAIGGALGGIIAIAVDANYKSAPPENYFFGPGGIIDIRVVK